MNDTVILMIVAIGFAGLGFGLWTIYQWVNYDPIVDPETYKDDEWESAYYKCLEQEALEKAYKDE